MYPLETIKALNNRPLKIKDNFNRDSSFVQSKAGFVIHSGIHRSTAFVSKDEHPEGFQSACFWFALGKLAINGWIEATENDIPLDGCERNAIAKLWPEWTFSRVNSCGNVVYSAKRHTGKLAETVSALSWQALHERLK